jgi:hypothetical protein
MDTIDRIQKLERFRKEIEYNVDRFVDSVTDFEFETKDFLINYETSSLSAVNSIEEYMSDLLRMVMQDLNALVKENKEIKALDASTLTDEEEAVVSSFLKDIKTKALDYVRDPEYKHDYESKEHIVNELFEMLNSKMFGLKRFKNFVVKTNEPAIGFNWRGKKYRLVIMDD